MIVRDEAAVIRRCLDSVRLFIDAWVIVDTGSTDGTQDVIREYLRDLPGELFERPWVDFAHNRNEALEYARGRADYLLFIDADEVLVAADGFRMPELTLDAYDLESRVDGMSYLRRQLVRAATPWTWKGVLHEHLDCDVTHTFAVLPGLHTEPHCDGARSRDPNKYRRDALVLERALLDEPDDPRYTYYLAQTYHCVGDFELALRWYRRRAAMTTGWTDEVWYSLYRIGTCLEQLKAPWPEVMAAYLAAYEHSPDRAGPLHRIGAVSLERGEHQAAYLFLKQALEIPCPGPHRIFVERNLYEYRIAIDFAHAAFRVKQYVQAVRICNQLLRSGNVPPELVPEVIGIRRSCLDRRLRTPVELADPPITVVVAPGEGMDACLDAIAAQDLESVRVVTTESLLDVARAAPGNSVILALRAQDRLADAGVLRAIVEDFRTTGKVLWYGQHRLAGGELGNAEPAPDREAFLARGAARAGASPIAFRVDLVEDSVDIEELWKRATLDRTWFSDLVATFVAAPPAPAPAVAVMPLPAALAAQPRISCLMVTRNRLLFAERAIEAFAGQSYPNRELVIVAQGSAYAQALERAAQRAGVAHCTVITAEDDAPLGRLRNLSIEAATGDLLCQWDDDDGYHRDRLLLQAEALMRTEARASALTGVLQWFEQERMLFLSEWPDCFPASIMFRRDDAPRYPEEADGAFLDALRARGEVVPVDAPHLYLYRFHGGNTCGAEHHRLAATSRTNPRRLHALRDRVCETISHCRLPRPLRAIDVDGRAYSFA
jgi:glycosyltransferase involved in cell wall biosynthesis